MTTRTARRLAGGFTATAAVFALSGGMARADHDHFIYQPEQGNHPATCRYISAGQTEKLATDPGGHAFHDHVHIGQPGSDTNGTDFDKSSNAGLYVCEFVNEPAS